MSNPQLSAVDDFRDMHRSGCFLLPNPWDRGTARFLEHLGYRAVATTSAGLAFSLGLPDASAAIPKTRVLEHIRHIVESTSLPVNADFQSGYSEDIEGLASNVSACVRTGVAGLSIEDATGDPGAPLYERRRAIERVAAARRSIDDTGIPVVLTARCEAWLVRHPEAERVVLDRLVAFADAGADCLYAPGAPDAETIERIVAAVEPKPVNVLMAAPHDGLTVSALANLGVRRISVGSALARAAWGAFIRAAEGILETGRFDALAGAAAFETLNRVFDVADDRASEP